MDEWNRVPRIPISHRYFIVLAVERSDEEKKTTHPLGLTLVAFAPSFFATGSISWYSIHTVLYGNPL